MAIGDRVQKYVSRFTSELSSDRPEMLLKSIIMLLIQGIIELFTFNAWVAQDDVRLLFKMCFSTCIDFTTIDF